MEDASTAQFFFLSAIALPLALAVPVILAAHLLSLRRRRHATAKWADRLNYDDKGLPEYLGVALINRGLEPLSRRDARAERVVARLLAQLPEDQRSVQLVKDKYGQMTAIFPSVVTDDPAGRRAAERIGSHVGSVISQYRRAMEWGDDTGALIVRVGAVCFDVSSPRPARRRPRHGWGSRPCRTRQPDRSHQRPT